MTRLFVLLLLLGCTALDTAAQASRVTFRGRGEPGTDARIREILREPGWTVWTRDTLLSRRDTVHGRLLVAGATVRIEGTVLDELVVLGGDVFVRPSGRLLGPVHNIAGGWYPSDLATLSGGVTSEPNAPYDVERTGDDVVVIGTTRRRAVEPEPIIPTYDRVDGVSVGAGAAWSLPWIGRVEPTLRGWGVYRSERGQVDPGAELRFRRARTTLAGGAERTTLTNQRWIRADLTNSISYLFQGKDYRDYYQAERAWVELSRFVERGAWSTELRLRAQVEDATSLRAGEPWSILRPDSIRPNGFRNAELGETTARSADDGRITSLIAGTRLSWERATFTSELDGFAELGIDALDSDFRFARYELTADFAMLALRNHTLEFDVHFRGPLPGGESDDGQDFIPRQRWSFVGGSGTLYTFDTAEFYGDRVAFVETVYSMPMGRRFRTPYLGIPAFELLHNAGMAWRRDQDRSFEQNVGVRLAWSVAYLRAVTNPEDLTGDVEFSAGVRFPRGSRPWEAAGGFF